MQDASGTNISKITDQGDIRHLSKVLRLREGDEIDVSDSMEWEYRAEIVRIDEEEVLLVILDKQKFAREPNLR